MEKAVSRTINVNYYGNYGQFDEGNKFEVIEMQEIGEDGELQNGYYLPESYSTARAAMVAKGRELLIEWGCFRVKIVADDGETTYIYRSMPAAGVPPGSPIEGGDKNQ